MGEVVDAVVAGNTTRLRELLEQDPSGASDRDENGVSAVLHARYRDRTDLVELLLRAGVPLDIFEAAAVGDHHRTAALIGSDSSAVQARSVDGYTALHLAAFFGHVDTVRLLLESGADPMAVSRNAMRVMPLHSAVAGSDERARQKVAELLLEHGAAVDARSHGGLTPLMEAAQNGDPDLTALLLDRGADPSLRSDRGTSAADMAVTGGHANVGRMLRARGA